MSINNDNDSADATSGKTNFNEIEIIKNKDIYDMGYKEGKPFRIIKRGLIKDDTGNP